jgi:5'-nucleotidase
VNKFTVALDMDSTVYDMHARWLAWLEREHGEQVTVDQIISWDWHEWLKCGKKVYDWLHIEGEFGSLVPYAGAIEAINKVHEMGVRQFFVSTIVSRTGAFEKQKCVERDFPYLAKDVLITSGSKDLINADMLVDDGPHNLVAFSKTGKLTCKVPYKYNETTEADYVLKSWDEYPEIVLNAMEYM